MQIFNRQLSLIRLVTGSNRNELLVSESFLHCLYIYIKICCKDIQHNFRS